MERPINYEHSQLLQSGDEEMNAILNKMGGNKTSRDDQLSNVEAEGLKLYEREAAEKLHTNIQLMKKVKFFTDDLKIFIDIVIPPQSVSLESVLEGLQNYEYEELYSLHESHGIQFVVPAFDVNKFEELYNSLKQEGLLEKREKLGKIITQLTQKLEELNNEIEIGKKWHKDYHAGIRGGAKKLEEEIKNESGEPLP